MALNEERIERLNRSLDEELSGVPTRDKYLKEMVGAEEDEGDEMPEIEEPTEEELPIDEPPEPLKGREAEIISSIKDKLSEINDLIADYEQAESEEEEFEEVEGEVSAEEELPSEEETAEEAAE